MGNTSIRTVLKYPLVVYQNSDSVTNPICDELEKYGKPHYHAITNDLYVYHNMLRHKDVIGFTTDSTAKNSSLMTTRSDFIMLPIRNISSINNFAVIPEDYWQSHQQVIKDFITIYQSLV